mmetsp:Transcript_56073/g.97280  ORF Transcript_56073/g.97280 Transcript_56073/m.97280 type:complete len:91 (+) Transcript_56073:25-297(+)
MLLFSRGLSELCLVGLNDTNDDSKKAKRTAKNLNDEHLHEELRSLSISKSAATSGDAHANATDQVGEPYSETDRKEAVATGDGVQLPLRW